MNDGNRHPVGAAEPHHTLTSKENEEKYMQNKKQNKKLLDEVHRVWTKGPRDG